jgi:hypothetical protein
MGDPAEATRTLGWRLSTTLEALHDDGQSDLRRVEALGKSAQVPWSISHSAAYRLDSDDNGMVAERKFE